MNEQTETSLNPELIAIKITAVECVCETNACSKFGANLSTDGLSGKCVKYTGNAIVTFYLSAQMKPQRSRSCIKLEFGCQFTYWWSPEFLQLLPWQFSTHKAIPPGTSLAESTGADSLCAGPCIAVFTLHGSAPQCLADTLQLASDVDSRRRLLVCVPAPHLCFLFRQRFGLHWETEHSGWLHAARFWNTVGYQHRSERRRRI